MNDYDGKLFVRIGYKGEIAFVRFANLKVTHDECNIAFEIVWSCGFSDHLSIGETGVMYENDVLKLIENETIYEVTESIDPCQVASA